MDGMLRTNCGLLSIQETENQKVENTEADSEPKKAKVAAVSMGLAKKNLETQISGPRILEVEGIDCDN
jgi:hypothetical protein